jgi:uncharacterized membrane protein
VPSARRTIVINRPVDEVFAFFTDPSNELSWRSHLKEVSVQSPVTTGARIHHSMDGEMRALDRAKAILEA